MKNNTGFREMLRDRCPKVVSHALKWCKAKEKWLDYVYKEQIWILSSKKDRLKQTKLILGLESKNGFDFDSTIFWEGLTAEDHKYWHLVSNWVTFFKCKYAYIENAYTISKQTDKDIIQIKTEIITKWLKDLCPTTEDDEETVKQKNQNVNNLADFLIDCFEGNN